MYCFITTITTQNNWQMIPTTINALNCLIKQSRTKSDNELQATIIIIIVFISNKNNRNRTTSSHVGQPQLDLCNFASQGWKVRSGGKARGSGLLHITEHAEPSLCTWVNWLSSSTSYTLVTVWCSGSALLSINKVTSGPVNTGMDDCVLCKRVSAVNWGAGLAARTSYHLANQ